MRKKLFIVSLIGLMLLFVSCGVNSMKPDEQVNKNYSTGGVTGDIVEVTATPTSTTECEVAKAVADGESIASVTYIRTSDYTAGSAPTTNSFKSAIVQSINKTAGLIKLTGNFESGVSYTFKIYSEKSANTLINDVLKTNPSYGGSVLAGGTTTSYTIPAKTENGNDMYYIQWEDGTVYNNKWVSSGWTYPASPVSIALPAVSTSLPAEAGSAEGRRFRVWVYKSY